MAMQILQARQIPNVGYQFRILLDTARVDASGAPDPRWVVEYTWGAAPPQGQTVAQYRATVLAEAKALAAADLAKRVAAGGTALAEEGSTF